MRLGRAAITAAVLFLPMLTAKPAHGECIKVTNQSPLDVRKGSILLKGSALSVTPLGEPARTYGFKVVFDVERVWKGRVGKRIEIYQDLSAEQAQFGVGASSYYLVTEITDPARRLFFGITGTTPAYAPLHCGLEDYSASEIMGFLEMLGPGNEPSKSVTGRR
jgi:hypothetical protein